MLEGDRAKRYSALKTRFFLADLAVSIAGAVVFFMFFAFPLEQALSGVSGGRFYVNAFLFGSVLYVFLYLIGLPIHYYASFELEHDFGLSRQSFRDWLKDEAKSRALSYMVFIGSVMLFLMVLRTFPGKWWLVLGGLWLLFSVVLTKLLPVLIIPLFYKYYPLEDQILKEGIMDLASEMDLALTDVSVIDLSRKTRKANAALTGLGSSRRVILSDTLLEEFTPEEVKCVVAHEFAHFRGRHIWKLLTFSCATTFTAFFLLSLIAGSTAAFFGSGSIWEVALLPVYYLMLVLFSLLVMPFQNWFSRMLEREADLAALRYTPETGSFVSVMEKLARMNLAETEPSLLKKVLFYDHPPISERIRLAENVPG